MPKNLKGETVWAFETPICCKISEKFEEGTLWRQKNQKKSQKAKHFRKGDPIDSSGFVSHVKNGTNELGLHRLHLDAFPPGGPAVQ